MNILFYEHVVYEFLLFYDFFPSMKSRSVAYIYSFSAISYKKNTKFSFKIVEFYIVLVYIVIILYTVYEH